MTKSKVTIKKNINGGFQYIITHFVNGKRLWSETCPVRFLHKEHAIEAAKEEINDFKSINKF